MEPGLSSAAQEGIPVRSSPAPNLRHPFTELPKANTVEDLERLLPYNLDPASFRHD